MLKNLNNNIQNQEVISTVLELINRFSSNIPMKKLRKLNDNAINEYLYLITQFATFILNNTNFHIQNDCIPSLIEVFLKLNK